MIVRIIGEGQWTVRLEDLTLLNEHDDQVEAALASDDQEALTQAVTALLHEVRENGTPVADDTLVESDLILPDAAVTLEQMREFLDARASVDGLIPD